MPQQSTDTVREGYDTVADEYVRRIYDELQHKPLDRQLLDRFAEQARGRGIVCDIGCGPGHVGRYLHERGSNVCGVDLSPAMIERARRLNPGIQFSVDDMLALNVADRSWAGIAAFYAIVNFPPADIPIALREMGRALEPGGLLLLSFHVGEEVVHLDDWWDQKVDMDFFFFRTDFIVSQLKAAGFAVEEIIEREPYPDVEHQSRRAYVFARMPEAAA